MKVFSIFNSISGEIGAVPQGTLMTFIRLAGCNLRCAWCFGIKPGRRIPRIITSTGQNKKLHEVKKGDQLMTFSPQGKLVETIVTDFLIREVDSWLEILIEDRLYFVTEEHPFFTTKGLINACDLQIGDMVYHSSPTDKISFSKIGERNPMKRKEVAEKSRINTDYKKIGALISTAIQKKKIKGTYKSTWEQLTPKKKEEARKKHSMSKQGINNPNWKGGINSNYTQLKKEVKDGLHRCSSCSSVINIDVHHKDENRQNDTDKNLQVLCHSCHGKIHQIGYNFWNGKRADGKCLTSAHQLQNGFEVKKIKQVNRFDSPLSIRPNALKVYNLSCAPYDSYLIDYMWVHNCDTEKALSPDSGTEMTVEEIVYIVRDIGCYHILITGGEPLTQRDELQELIYGLNDEGFAVSIETNGSLVFDLRGADWIVDYKLPSSKMMVTMLSLEDFAHLLSGTDIIKFVVSTREDYDTAKQKTDGLTVMGVHATMSFSAAAPLSHAELIEWMQVDRLWHIPVSVQIHKMIFPAGEKEK